LYTIDKVKEGINLRAYGQKDPLIEYKKEAFKAFEELNNIIKTETVEKIMRVQLQVEGMQEALERMRPEEVDMDDLDYTAPDESSVFESSSAKEMVRSNSVGLENAQQSQPQKRRLVAGPASRQDNDRPQNRADRRKTKNR